MPIDSVEVGNGVWVDLGSAALVKGWRQRLRAGSQPSVRLGCVPLVEGAVLAAWAMSAGGSLDAEVATAEPDRQKTVWSVYPADSEVFLPQGAGI